MRLLTFLIIATIMKFTSSCTNSIGCKKISITQDEKKWLKFANLSDTLLFINKINNVDTFVVSVTDDNDYTDCNLFERGTNQYESNAFSMQRTNTLRSYPSKDKVAKFVFKRNVNNQSDSLSYKHFTVFDFRTEGFENFADFTQVDLELTTTNSKYKAYFFDRSGTRSNKDGSAVFITSFWWSKENGLLKYETASGEVFEFLKKY